MTEARLLQVEWMLVRELRPLLVLVSLTSSLLMEMFVEAVVWILELVVSALQQVLVSRLEGAITGLLKPADQHLHGIETEVSRRMVQPAFPSARSPRRSEMSVRRSL